MLALSTGPLFSIERIHDHGESAIRAKLFITGLSGNISAIQLKTMIQEYGRIHLVAIRRSDQGPLALVEMSSREEAERVRLSLPAKLDEPFLGVFHSDSEKGRELEALWDTLVRDNRNIVIND